MIPIKTPQELAEHLKNDQGDYDTKDFFIALAGGLARSSKTISYYPDDDVFDVFNDIDGTYQELTGKDILDPAQTNIGEAMEKGAFYAYL